jgi:hypothetical protein
MKHAVAHKRCNSAEPGRQESRFQRRGAGPSHDSRDGPRQPQVTRKTILITAGLDAEAGDLHRREAARNAGVRIVVRVAAEERVATCESGGRCVRRL